MPDPFGSRTSYSVKLSIHAVYTAGATVKSVADTGSGSDSISQLSASLSLSETGSGADSINVTSESLKSITDDGAGADAVSSIAVSVSLSDTGAGADVVALESVSAQIVLGKQHQSSPLSTSSTYYGTIFGKQFYTAACDVASQVVPCAGTFDRLYVRLSGAPSPGSYTFTVYHNGVATDLAVTISGSNQTGSDIDADHAFSVAAGDTVAIEAAPSDSPTARWLSSSIRFAPTTDGETILLSSTNGGTWASYLPYYSLTGTSSVGDSDDTAVGMVLPCAGTVKKLYAKVINAPGTGNGYIFTVLKEGSSTALTCTISGSSTTAADTEHTFSVAAGDVITLGVSESGSPSANWGTMEAGVVFLPDTKGNYVVPHVKINDTTTDGYYFQVVGELSSGSTESNYSCMAPSDLEIKEIWAHLWGGSLSGSQVEIITLRKNGANTSLAVQLDSTHPEVNGAAYEITCDDFDLLTHQYSLSGGAALPANVSLLCYLTIVSDGATVKSVTDTGSGSDSISQLLAALALTDTGAGSDALSQLLAALGLTDTGAGSDAAPGVGVSIGLTDTGAGSDAAPGLGASLAVADTGAGSDGAPTITVTLTLTDTGSGADIISILTEVLKTLTDSGAGTDAVSAISVSFAASDTGSGSDEAPTVTVVLTVADTGSGADIINVLTEVLKTITDTAAGTDAVSSVTVSLSVPDTATGSDAAPAATISFTLTDTGSGADLLDVIKTALQSIADSGSGVDTISAIAVVFAAADTGTGSDAAPGVTVTLTLTDSASGTDVLSLIKEALKSITDSGSGADAISAISVSVPVSDAGSAADLIAAITAALTVSDIGAGVDVAVGYDASIKLVTITFSIKRRSVGFSMKKRGMTFALNS